MATDPLATALGPDEAGWAREHLERDVVGWLTTVARDGTPKPSIISFLWDGDSILFYSKPDTLKLRNIARSPAVSFHLGTDRFGDHALIIEGIAEIDPATPPSDVHSRYREKYREPLAHWEMDEAETARDYSVPIRIRPRRVRLG
ncbi:MAG TPA: pyridoxamine 5'-phosphate oxidase family protein [Candidatus Limnocylindrales bacterium]|jgi:PPOX class probable F420-dependent enzyme|nr:pyridoxamine 5'-phosphate oxidase family protein [Candidatus Limnocylindrales bacterium]